MFRRLQLHIISYSNILAKTSSKFKQSILSSNIYFFTAFNLKYSNKKDIMSRPRRPSLDFPASFLSGGTHDDTTLGFKSGHKRNLRCGGSGAASSAWGSGGGASSAPSPPLRLTSRKHRLG